MEGRDDFEPYLTLSFLTPVMRHAGRHRGALVVAGAGLPDWEQRQAASLGPLKTQDSLPTVLAPHSICEWSQSTMAIMKSLINKRLAQGKQSSRT
jgi:hypothetical protein